MGANEDLLMQYCLTCDTSSAIYLIETNLVDININDSEPMKIAVENDCSTMVQYLIECGSKINMERELCLRSTVQELDYVMTKILLDAGANPNVSSSDGFSDSAFCISDLLDDPSMNELIGPY